MFFNRLAIPKLVRVSNAKSSGGAGAFVFIVVCAFCLQSCGTVESPSSAREGHNNAPKPTAVVPERTGDNLPPEWPVPVPADAVKVEVGEETGGQRLMLFVHDAPLSAVAAFYRKELSHRGWKVEDVANTPLAPVAFSASGPTKSAILQLNPEGTRTSVRVSLVDHNSGSERKLGAD